MLFSPLLESTGLLLQPDLQEHQLARHLPPPGVNEPRQARALLTLAHTHWHSVDHRWGALPDMAPEASAAIRLIDPGLQFDAGIRRIVCTTNAIESVKARIRRAVQACGHFPSSTSGRRPSSSLNRSCPRDVHAGRPRHRGAAP